jgi:hypothetical protein
MRNERLDTELYIIREIVNNKQVQTYRHAVGTNAV